MKKLLLTALLFFALSLPVSAAGIVLTPPKFEFNAKAGETINDVVKITNNDPTPLVLNAEAQDFVASGETGQPAFISPEKNDVAISLAKWININNGQQVTILPGEKKEIPFTITVPATAEPGGKYGTIFFFPPSQGGQVAIVQKIGSLVLVRVAGDVKEEGKLETFGAFDPKMTGEEVAQSSSQFFFELLPINFSVRYHNTGNVHIKPQGKIQIYNMFGQKLDPAGVLTVVNEAGVEMKKELVDYVSVNDSHGNVLAKSTRKFDSAWQGTPYWFQKEDGTKEVRYKGFPVGIYKAELSLTGAKGEQITQTVRFVVFPWKHIFGGAILLFIVIFGFIKYRKWSHKRFEAELRKRMKAEK